MKHALLLGCFAALCFGQRGAPVAPGSWDVSATEQTTEGHISHLRGHAEMRGTGITFRADEIDYDADKAVVRMTGDVTIETTNKGTLHADDATYNVTSGEIALKLKLVPAP